VFLFRLIHRFAFASSGARNDKSKFARPFTLFASFADGRGNCNRSGILPAVFLQADGSRKQSNRFRLTRWRASVHRAVAVGSGLNNQTSTEPANDRRNNFSKIPVQHEKSEPAWHYIG
jgi:hypothetical protein